MQLSMDPRSVGKKKAKICCIIYLHKITDIRVTTRPEVSVRCLKMMCKKTIPDNVRSILVTTMWNGKQDPQVCGEREKQLREGWTKSMPGMKIVRYDMSFALSLNIVQYALGEPGVELSTPGTAGRGA